MKIRLLFLAALPLSSMLVTAQQRDTARQHDDWTAPPAEAARTSPLATRADLIEGGKKIFAQRCSACHGAGAEGTPAAPSLIRAGRGRSDGELFWKISSGNTRTGMPTFSFLPPLQRWQVVLYLRAQSDHPSTTAREPLAERSSRR